MLQFTNCLNLIFVIFYALTFEISSLRDYCNNDDVHALILARGGSKSIPLKNLLSINGVSLLARSIQTIQELNYFESIWVSTDDERIAKEALKFGALVHKRSKYYAQDNTSSIESTIDFLMHKQTINRFALFQCTSIFLKKEYVVAAVEKFQHCDCVFAATRNYKLRWQRQRDGRVLAINFNSRQRPRRQDWEGEFTETGMFYFSNRDLVVKEHRFQNDRCSLVEIAAADALEIDEPIDVYLANCLIANNKDSL